MTAFNAAARSSLSFAGVDFVNSKPVLTRLGVAVQGKAFASHGFFAIDPCSIPADGISYVAEQLAVEAGEIAGYDFSSRTARRHCVEILNHLGFHRMKRADRQQLERWIAVPCACHCKRSVREIGPVDFFFHIRSSNWPKSQLRAGWAYDAINLFECALPAILIRITNSGRNRITSTTSG